jgi:spore coat protein H
MDMPESQFKKVVAAKGQKIVLKNTTLTFDGKVVPLKEVHLHGNTTLNFERKSFSVDADEKIRICDTGCKPMDAIYLMSLSMEKNYYHNRLCFDLLKSLNLFPLQYKFVEVRINDNSQGIYLILQRPQDWSRKSADSPFILRRGTQHEIAKERTTKDLPKDSVRRYRQQFGDLYKSIHQYHGKALYERLERIMHVDEYLRWMAFNYIIRNGDYSDELYFYIDPDTRRYRIIPWDYDDIFKKEPHEGMDVWKNRMDHASLVFSSEDDLDRAIAHDEYLYNKYLEKLADVMKELNAEKIDAALECIYQDLSPLFGSVEILKACERDGYTTSLERLQAELVTVNQYFSFMRSSLLKGK